MTPDGEALWAGFVKHRAANQPGKWIIPPVGTGTGRRPRAISFYQGGMKEAFPDMPEAMQKRMLGVSRYNMYKAGDLTIDQMVDPKTGKLFLLKEIEQGMHLGRITDPTDLTQYKPTPLKTPAVAFDKISDDLVEELVAVGRAADLEGPSDDVLRRMNQLTGADAKPTVVSAKLFDQLEAQSDNIAFRSVEGYKRKTGQELLKQFREGDFFAGKGIYGNGTYASGVDKKTFTQYAPKIDPDVDAKIKDLMKKFGEASRAGNESLADDLFFEIHALRQSVKAAKDIRITNSLDTIGRYGTDSMRMMLKPGAKVVKASELDVIFDSKVNAVKQLFEDQKVSAIEAMDKAAFDVAQEKIKAIDIKLRNIYHDDGRKALSMGYDAIEVPHASGEKFYVYLNRGALIVDETDYTPKTLKALYEKRNKEW
jgi:hypothetical protein